MILVLSDSCINFIRNKKNWNEWNHFLIEEALEGGYTEKAIEEGIFTEGDTSERNKTKY